MFGNVSACRHTLGDQREEWRAAMCGSCLALRDGSGQLARAFLNTDAIAAAVLAGDAGGVEVDTRRAGPCPARAFRTATVWDGPAARVGAAVSLLAAGVTLGDAATDRDVPLAGLTARPARSWARRLLAETSLPVAAVAVRVGAGSVQAFTTLFRQSFGSPPAAWRARQGR